MDDDLLDRIRQAQGEAIARGTLLGYRGADLSMLSVMAGEQVVIDDLKRIEEHNSRGGAVILPFKPREKEIK